MSQQGPDDMARSGGGGLGEWGEVRPCWGR